MGILYGRAGRLTAKNGGFRPGQATLALDVRVILTSALHILYGESRMNYTGWRQNGFNVHG